MKKSLGQVFSSAWNSTKVNFLTLFCVTIIYNIIFWAIGLGTGGTAVSGLFSTNFSNFSNYDFGGVMDYGSAGTAAAYAGTAGFSMLMLVALIFLTPLYTSFVGAVLVQYDRTRIRPSFASAWAMAKANYMRYLTSLLATILFALIFVIIIVIIFVPVMLGVLVSSGISYYGSSYSSLDMSFWGALIPMMIVAAVLGVLFGFAIMPTNYIPAAEGKGGFRSVFASFKYMFKGGFLRNLGHFIIIAIIVGLISNVLTLPQTAVANMQYYMPQSNFVPALIALSLLVVVVNSVVSIYQNCYNYEVYKNARFTSDVNERVKYLQAPGGSGNYPTYR